jgi:hypothetical protein
MFDPARAYAPHSRHRMGAVLMPFHGYSMRAGMVGAALVSAALLWSAPVRGDALDPALAELNKISREAYAGGRQALLARTQPVIVVEFDDLLLLRDDKETRAPFTPTLYHALKSVSHLPLGIYGALVPAASGDAAADWRPPLQAMRDRALVAAGRLDTGGFSEAQLARQRKIVDESIGFIERTLAAASVSADGLRAYAQEMAPLTLANAADAARAQVDGLHAAFTAMKAQMSAAELARLHVLVLGPKTPRAGNLQYEYFVNALGPGSGEKRVIYAESIFDKDRALSLLGTLVIDRRIGADFYGDEARMERDLLSDGAAARILQIFGRLGSD